MSLPEEVSVLKTADQIVEWIFGLSVGGTRAEKCKRLKRLLLLYRGFSDRSSLSYLASNATQGCRDDLRGLEAHKDVDHHSDVPVSA